MRNKPNPNKAQELFKDMFHDAPINDGLSFKDCTSLQIRIPNRGSRWTGEYKNAIVAGYSIEDDGNGGYTLYVTAL